MPGQPIQIGPFLGGLNTYSDETAVADNELVVCENFELDLDGSLKSRPPIAYRSIDFPLEAASGNIRVLGYYYGPGNVPYLLASDGVNSTYFFNGTSWALVTSTVAARAMTQFDGKAWLTGPIGGAPGGYWTPGGGFVVDANMPHGDVIESHKFRLWVAAGKDALTNPTRLYFSNVLGSPTFWAAAPDFIDIGAGDGQAIVQVKVFYNALLIFRTHSIFSYQYTTDPANGATSLVVPGVGLSDEEAIVVDESYLYFMYDDKAYEFSNNRANQINVKVPFTSNSRIGIYSPYHVSTFNQRIIFSFWDRLYVFSLRTRTWTVWTSTVHASIGPITSAKIETVFEEAIAFSNQSVPIGPGRVAKTLHIVDGLTTDAENMECIAQTKNYNYEASSAFKRLFWWGVDAVFRGRVTAIAVPVVFKTNPTWGQLLPRTWSQVRTQTWGSLVSDSAAIETIRDTEGSESMRKFVKFRKSLRFRQIYFRLVFETDGSLSTAPVRLFSLMTYVRPHERVTKTTT